MKNKRFHKLFAGVLAFALGLSALALPAFAATVDEATIDTGAKASLTIYKYDFTQAQKDGVWDVDSFVSTGYKESYVENALGGTEATKVGDTDNVSDLGNGQTSNGYAIKGVEFTIKNVAEITTFSAVVDGKNETEVLYGFDKSAAADLLTAIGLGNGHNAFEHASLDKDLSTSKWYYTADALNKALSDTAANNPTELRDALEKFIKGGITMPLTDADGYTKADNLSVGLYLVVETKVPEMVTNTTAPFFVSLPMTTVDGDANKNSSNPDGGHEWNYDVVVYPKNETGIPTLEKTLREKKEDTGHNEGSSAIDDGYEHNTTASSGDVIEYQIITTLPSITSQATALSEYSFVDTLSKGLTYNEDVTLTFFSDKDCKKEVDVWKTNAGEFTAAFTHNDAGDSTMKIVITEAGLAKINGYANTSSNVNNKSTAPNTKYTSYSNYTLRITYTATLDANATTVLGEAGNKNEVVMTWRRSSTEYFDTLNDDCHVYTFGIDLTKTFSDQNSEAADADFAHVKFKLRNVSDSYWVTADLQSDGIYYVTGHVDTEEAGTTFIPQTVSNRHGIILIRGLEDDTYELTEIETANGYTLLKDKITVVITKDFEGEECDVYTHDTLGVTQNDSRYDAASVKGSVDPLTNIPQAPLSHQMMQAKATVDTNEVTMQADGDSENGIVTLTVVNRPGFELPPTGERSMLLFTVIGASLMVASAMLIVIVAKKKKNQDNA